MAILGRSQPIRPHLARPVVAAQVFPAVAEGTFVYQAQRMPSRFTRGSVRIPAPLILPFAPPPVVTSSTMVGQALNRAFSTIRGRGEPLRPHLAKPIVAPLVVAPVIAEPLAITVQSVRRALNRGSVPKPQIARAVLAAPRAPPLLLVGQALRRPYVGRTVPKPHLAPPVVGAQVFPPVVSSSTVIGQSLNRVFGVVRGRGQPFPAHLAKPVLVSAPLADAVIVFQAVRRALTRREAGKVHLPNPLITPSLGPAPMARGTFTFVRGRFIRGRVHIPNPLIVPQVGGGVPLAPAKIVSQVPERSIRPRPPQRPHVAGPIVGVAQDDSVILLAAVNVSQAVKRAQLRPRLLEAHVAAPVTVAQQPPVPRGKYVYQAVRRALTKRGVPEPHVALPVVGQGQGFVGSKAVQTVQAVARALRGREAPKPHLAEPVVGQGQGFIGSEATQIRQAVGRALVGRRVPGPHLAKPSVGGPPLAPAKVTVVRGRWFRGATRTAPPIVTQIVFPPVAAGVTVSQARQRATLQRRVPAPHVAEPIVAPGGPPLRPGLVVTVRGRFLRGRTKTAPPVVNQIPPPNPLAPAVVVSQAIRRALVGRGAPKPHVPVLPVSQPPVPAGKVTLVRGRFLRGRTKTAPPVVTQQTFPPVPPAVVVGQAVRRALLRREAPKPHVAKPPLVQGPVKPATVVGQALRRALVKRGVPQPHVAEPIIGPGAGFIGSRAVRVLQAIRRALIGRTPPPPHTAPPRPALPIPDANPTIIVGHERFTIEGHEEFGIVGRERFNISGTEDFGIVGREAQWLT